MGFGFGVVTDNTSSTPVVTLGGDGADPPLVF